MSNVRLRHRYAWIHALTIVATFAVSIWLCEFVSFWFYPFAIFLIGSRIFALSLIGHECVHGLLFRSPKWNSFVGRWLCHFPCLISHSHFGRIHLLHHRYLGETVDPDLYIYQKSWSSPSAWVWNQLTDILTLRSFFAFQSYSNGLPQRLLGKYPFRGQSDHGLFVLFWIVIVGAFASTDGLEYLILYWLVPYITWGPWVLLVNHFHHYHDGGVRAGFSRDLIFQNRVWEELLFPLSINFHHAHHMQPHLPHYELRSASQADPGAQVPIRQAWKLLFFAKGDHDSGLRREKVG
ncbi:MAG: fatty acid desaturase [Bdellovibrionaceae bacterium]|nr:fatty acid desaturase [Pseudobdellovibrionaceae bacterium]